MKLTKVIMQPGEAGKGHPRPGDGDESHQSSEANEDHGPVKPTKVIIYTWYMKPTKGIISVKSMKTTRSSHRRSSTH